MTGSIITRARLAELLSYDPETGVFRWIKPTSNRVRAGSVAGRNHGNGYLRISLDKQSYYLHRLAWLWIHGEFPTGEVDHRDGVRSNNRASNLRAAEHRENAQNQPLKVSNTSGRHGVSWSKLHDRWAAYIHVAGRKRHLGLFDDLDSAGRAYLKAKAELHPFQPVPRDCAHA